MSDLSKTFTLAEVEGFLAAERERCAKVAEDPKTWWDDVGAFGSTHDAVAAAIRNLPPKPIEGE